MVINLQLNLMVTWCLNWLEIHKQKTITPEAVIKKVDMGIEVTGDENYQIENLDFNL